MNAKVYLAGLAGGLLVTAALIYPAYLWVPYLYLTDWPFGGDVPATLLSALALVLLFVTGFAAARLSGLATRLQGAGAGAVAGLMAAMLSFGWMVRPAAGVFGAADLFAHGPVPAEGQVAYIKLLLDAVTGIGWWTNMAFVAWLLAGILLATLGGLAAGPRGEPDKHWALYGLPLALTGILLAGLMMSLDLASMGSVIDAAKDSALENGLTLAYPLEAMLFVPLAFDWLCLLLWQVLVWRTLRSLASGAEARARLWTFAGYFSLVFPIVMFFWLLLLDNSRWVIYLAGMAVSVGLGWRILRASRSLLHLPLTDTWAFRGRRWPIFFAIVAALVALLAFSPLAGTSMNLVTLVVAQISFLDPAAPASAAAGIEVAQIVRQSYQAGWYITGWIVIFADLLAGIYVAAISYFVTTFLPRLGEVVERAQNVDAEDLEAEKNKDE